MQSNWFMWWSIVITAVSIAVGVLFIIVAHTFWPVVLGLILISAGPYHGMVMNELDKAG